jgi:uridine kinase
VIGVAGGSGSGKSVFALALAARLHPRTVVLISEDDYYRRFDGPGFDPSRFDFDVPAARDHAHLAADLARLRQGLSIDRPVYSFRRHAPLKRTIPTAAAAVVIVEGLHVLHDAQVRALLDFSVFLDVEADIRFIRRLLRDIRQRGRSVHSVVSQYLATVKPAHDRYVEPAKALASLVLTDAAAGVGDTAVSPRWLDETLGALGSDDPPEGAAHRD